MTLQINAERFNATDIISLIHSGKITAETIDELLCLSRLSNKEVARLLGLSTRTFDRIRKAAKERLSDAIQERIIVLMALYQQGHRVFKSREAFDAWLRQENTHLGGKQPYEYLSFFAGIRFVHNRLYAMELGYNP